MSTPDTSYREIHPVADQLKAEKERKYDREYYAKNRQYFSEKSRIYREKNKKAPRSVHLIAGQLSQQAAG